jgi:hypothetical protein
VSVWLIVQEAKWLAVGGYTRAQSDRWNLWLKGAEHVDRARPIPPVTIGGNSWAVECTTREEARWLADYLVDACGFTETMLSITKKWGDW